MLRSKDSVEADKELILRDHLAIERTKLANERTLFSYIRTSLYLLTAGIGILQFDSISRLYWLAWICMAAGVILFFLGFYRFGQMSRYLKKICGISNGTEETHS